MLHVSFLNILFSNHTYVLSTFTHSDDIWVPLTRPGRLNLCFFHLNRIGISSALKPGYPAPGFAIPMHSNQYLILSKQLTTSIKVLRRHLLLWIVGILDSHKIVKKMSYQYHESWYEKSSCTDDVLGRYLLDTFQPHYPMWSLGQFIYVPTTQYFYYLLY